MTSQRTNSNGEKRSGVFHLNSPMGLLCLACLLGLSACTSRLELGFSEAEEKVFLKEILAFAQEAEAKGEHLLSLDEDIRQLLDARIEDQWLAKRKLNALRELLFHEDALNIGYDASVTRTASETFYAGEGNCLSLTSLFVAAARHVGLDAEYLTVEVTPTWDHQGMTMIRYEHIVASGKISPGESYVVDFLPEFIISDQKTSAISDEKARALYYNNLGAEQLVAGKTQSGKAYLALSIMMDEGFSDAWNNLGIAMRRSGEETLAEYSFRKALTLDPGNYSALSNLARFYQQAGRIEEALQLEQRVERYRKRNPYFHFFLARLSLNAGDRELALEVLNNAIRLKKDEADFYQLAAAIYKDKGDEAQEEKYRQLAEKYKQEKGQPPPRTMGHRIWFDPLGRATRIDR